MHTLVDLSYNFIEGHTTQQSHSCINENLDIYFYKNKLFPCVIIFFFIKRTTTYFQHHYSQRLFLGTWFLRNRFAELCWHACHYTVWVGRLGEVGWLWGFFSFSFILFFLGS